jgi:DNA repair photolyase
MSLQSGRMPSMPIKYEEINCKNVLGRFGIIATRFWTNYCFDPYNNCEFDCVYCHAGIHKYNGIRDFCSSVYVKENAPRILARQLASLKMKGVLRLSEFTDPYQPAEEKYRVTGQILDVLKKHNWPFAIGTKSDLILRDLDLISQAAKKSWCCVGLSISTLDENLAKLLEPNAPSPRRRLEAVRRLSDEGVTVGVWLSPLIPYITDTNENMEKVVAAAVNNGARFVLGAMVDMRGLVGFERFLEEHFARLIPIYERLYKGRPTVPSPGNMEESYMYGIYRRFISLCERYDVESYVPHFCSRKAALLFYARNFSKFRGTPRFELNQNLNYMFPSKEFLQTVRIRCGDSSLTRSFLKTLGYFPN